MATKTTPNARKVTKLTNKEEVTFEQLRSSVGNLPDQWVACRDMRHAWDILNDFHVNGDGSDLPQVRRELVCIRCSTVRRETYENNVYGLDRVNTNYLYPDNYQLHGIPREISLQAVIRQDQYRRAMERIAAASKRKKASR